MIIDELLSRRGMTRYRLAVEAGIPHTLTYDTLHATEDNLWSALLMTGYITKANPDEVGDTVKFLSGIFVGRGYSVDSNKEKGLGRPDILLKDRKNRRAIIIETKKSDNESAMDRTCDEAIKQSLLLYVIIMSILSSFVNNDICRITAASYIFLYSYDSVLQIFTYYL